MGRRGGRGPSTWAVAPLVCVLALASAEPNGPATPTRYGDCGPDALKETGLQGQVPGADQRSGRSAEGYRCNVRLIGQSNIGLRGQNFQLAWYEDCAYVSTVGLQQVSGVAGEPAAPELDGIAAIDASNPRAPKLTDIVASPLVGTDVSAKSSHEAIEVNPERGLLVTTIGGLTARYIEVYDVKTDCAHPKYLGRYDAGIPIYHGLRVSDDGRTVYASDVYQLTGVGQVLHAIDISDPTHPKLLTTWDPLPEDQFGIHDLEVDEDGDRAYVGTAPYQAATGALVAGPPSKGDGTSLAVLDTSEIQQRKPGGKIKRVSAISLPNVGHTVQRMQIGGRRYLLVSGEAPFGGPHRCPWAWGHIVDITDERHPRRVSDLRLEVNRTESCGALSGDQAANYSIHYAGVDDEHDTRLAFFTYYNAGLRVFDVSDPAHPREIAYYNPPATPHTKFPSLSPLTPDSASDVMDLTTSVVRYRPETGALWVVSVNGGFQVLQLTGSAAPQKATVELLPGRGRTAAKRSTARARVACEQPCRGTLNLRVGGKPAGVTEFDLPLRASRVVEVPLSKAARRTLRRKRSVRLSVAADVEDALTGERQLSTAAARRLRR